MAKWTLTLKNHSCQLRIWALDGVEVAGWKEEPPGGGIAPAGGAMGEACIVCWPQAKHRPEEVEGPAPEFSREEP